MSPSSAPFKIQEFKLPDDHITGKLFVGPYPAGYRVSALQDQTVNTIVDLTHSEDALSYREELQIFNRYEFPIRPMGIPKNVQVVYHLAQEILKRLRTDQTIYMHCLAGKGRTGTIAACLLIETNPELRSGDDAISVVRARIDNAIETKEQAQFVRDYYSFWNERTGAKSSKREVSGTAAASHPRVRFKKPGRVDLVEEPEERKKDTEESVWRVVWTPPYHVSSVLSGTSPKNK